MINLNHLRVFFHAAKNLNYTRAAAELFITQPAVTAQIKAFEDVWNLKLFKKKGKKVYLTDEGLAIYEQARKVFECEKEIEHLIAEMRELKRGVLRIGTTKTYARYFMPLMITSFREKYPMIKIRLDEGSSLEMINNLHSLKNEVAILAKSEEDMAIHFVPFSQEELVLIMSPDHELAQKRRITFDEIAKEPIIMKEAGSGTQRLVNELFAKNGCVPNVLMESSNAEFIKQVVQRGEAIAFLVKEVVSAELREGKLATAAIKGCRMHLDVSIAYLKDVYLSPPARAFLEILENLALGKMAHQGMGVLMARIMERQRMKQT
jgi:DNA-binding transcriptional LysR family regulator